MAKQGFGINSINSYVPTKPAFALMPTNAQTYYSYSSDGINWLLYTMPGTSNSWRGAGYGNKTFVTAALNTTSVATSTDAISWTVRTLPVSRSWTRCIYGNGIFLLVGSSSTTAVTSTDAITWTTRTLPSNQSWGPISFGNDKFVLLSGSTSIVSTNGISWTSTALPSSATRTLAYGNGVFVALDNTISSTQSIVSTDGITWNIGTTATANTCYITYGNGLFYGVSVTGSSSYQTIYSTNGLTWTLGGTATPGGAPIAIQYGNGLIIITGDTSSFFAYSTNGITWTQGIGSRIATFGVISYADFVQDPIPVTSSELINAQQSISNIQNQLNNKVNSNLGTLSNVKIESASNINIVPNLFVAVANISSSSAYSTDGITWTFSFLPSRQNWENVIYANGRYVASSVFQNNGSIITSSNGINWNTTSIINTQAIPALAYGNNLYVASQGLGASSLVSTAYYSTDSISWNFSTMPSASQWVDMKFGNGIFCIVSWFTDGAAATSTNGITWTQRSLPIATRWVSLTYGNGIFLAIVNGSITPTTSAATSTNGINWTIRTLPSSQDWGRVAFGNGLFLTTAWGTSTAITSTDGISWTIRTMPSSGGWYAVGYGNGLFVASIYGTTTAAYSTDTITWTTTTMPIADNWNRITSYPFTSVVNLNQYVGQTQAINTNSYTVQPSDKFLTFNTTANCTVTLPNPGTFPGRELTLNQIAGFTVSSASSNVQPLTSTTLGTAILSGAGKFARLYSNGSSWVIIQSN